MELVDAALILVDIQNDFCPGGALAVTEGDQIVSVVNRLMPRFPLVVSTQDWHPANHISFKQRGGPWPPHCVQGTRGADLHPDLKTDAIAHYFRKASSPDKDDYSDTRDRGRSTARPGSSASCSSMPRTTSRSWCRARRPVTSTHCGASFIASSGNP